MKLCMVGCRGHFGYVLNDLPLLPNVSVVGVSAGTPEDKPTALIEGARKAGHEPEVFDDYREMLERQRPDVVCVDGPYERHAEMCVEAFRRGIHVFCEKPVALTMEDLSAVESAWRESGRQFAGMMGLRYDPAVYAAWTIVKSGAIGDVRLVDTRKSYRLGERPGFYRKRATYGGTIPWVGSHAFDWIAWFSGRRFQTVCARHSTAANRGHGDLEATALCLFTLEEDVLASASIDYLRPSNAPTHGDDRIRAVGTRGVVEVMGGSVHLINGEEAGERAMPAACDRSIFRDFAGQIAGGPAGLVSGEETIELARISLLALRSADEGRIVSCTA